MAETVQQEENVEVQVEQPEDQSSEEEVQVEVQGGNVNLNRSSGSTNRVESSDVALNHVNRADKSGGTDSNANGQSTVSGPIGAVSSRNFSPKSGFAKWAIAVVTTLDSEAAKD